MKKVIQIAAFAVAVFTMTYYLYLHPHLIESLRSIEARYLFVVFGFDVFFLISNSVILKLLLGRFQLTIPLRECVGISAVTSILNYFAPFGGGAAGKALYLKRKYDFPYASLVSAIFATNFMELLLASLLGAAAAYLLGLHSKLVLLAILCFFMLFSFVLAIPFVLKSPMIKEGKGRIEQTIREIVTGWQQIKETQGLLYKIGLLLLLNIAFLTVELFYCYQTLMIDVQASVVLLIVIAGYFSSIIRLVPGNLGVYEGVVGLGSQLAGVGFEQGFLAAGLARLVYMSVILSVGGLCSLLTFERGRL